MQMLKNGLPTLEILDTNIKGGDSLGDEVCCPCPDHYVCCPSFICGCEKINIDVPL
jgi:hypothetical protein